MPLTEKGYERPTYDDILEAQIDRAKVLFGDDIDTNENTPLGKYIRLNVTDLADVYEILEKIYYSRFPNTAKGVSLDRLCPFTGIYRNSATYAKHIVKFTGVAGESVPEAFEVSAGDVIFHIYDSYPFDESGVAYALVECDTAGTIGNVPLGSIDTIVNPDTNVESVEHLEVYELAKDGETDAELRERFNLAVSGAGAGTLEAIKSAISRVPLVKGVSIVENSTDTEVDGIPAHSFACYVLAPQSQDTLIAEAILSKKPLGINSVGDVDIELEDENGVTNYISFYRTTEVTVRIYVMVMVNKLYASSGYTEIKNNICNYVNSLKNGESVYLSQVNAQACKTNGVLMTEAFFLDMEYEEYIYYIQGDQVARLTPDDITLCLYDEQNNYIGGDAEPVEPS